MSMGIPKVERSKKIEWLLKHRELWEYDSVPTESWLRVMLKLMKKDGLFARTTLLPDTNIAGLMQEARKNFMKGGNRNGGDSHN